MSIDLAKMAKIHKFGLANSLLDSPMATWLTLTGTLPFQNLDIQPRLSDAIQDKKNPRRREGALFAFEMLCVMLGRLFEPYIVNILPHLLLCFGDTNQYVRVVSVWFFLFY